jgi:hypothetical protein
VVVVNVESELMAALSSGVNGPALLRVVASVEEFYLRTSA